MGLSRSTRIIILLIIDVCFFFAELITGYAVGSLALVADSFHMLNDVMSLVVALYAIKLTGKNASTTYSYGWHRAEILAALLNATFLLALCFSIFMEAIERFVNVSEVSNPMLVVILGCFGLTSNIIGLFLFHDHGDSHEPSHGHDGHDDTQSSPLRPQKKPSPHQTSEVEPLLINAPSPTGNGNGRRPRSRSPSVSSLYGHPVQTRAAVVATAQSLASSPPTSMSPLAHRRSSSSARGRPAHSHSRHNSTAALRPPGDMDGITEVNSGAATPDAQARSISPHEHASGHAHDHDHEPFNYAHPVDLEVGKSRRGHSHRHGSMNMRALVLHVMGDALGNVGVIASGLIIWLTTWQYRYYSDPIISLIITCIIFSSALPLVKSASFILLQGVPESVNLEDVRDDISAVEGVVSVHELHVWQLSESKHVASVHILIRKKDDFMRVVQDIRRVLHEHDIHNGTIQPEFRSFGDDESDYRGLPKSCLVTCPPGMCQDQTCCPPLSLSEPVGSSPT